ncbi:MAG: 50S ribosomal protein L35 [Candidatus Saccharibacteria bacterium]|nr:50S ribosomal protein L35 [Candidatus Saccharibacteria bacterium]
MPKMKTHKGTAKRIRITPTGKVMRQRAFGGHFLAKKSRRRKRIINTKALVSGKNIKNLKKVLGA